MPEELICPWCKKEVFVTSYHNGEYFGIECEDEDCPVQPTGLSQKNKKDAIDAWKRWE